MGSHFWYPPVMRDISKMISESQDFISTVKAFQSKQEQLEKNYELKKHEARISIQDTDQQEEDEDAPSSVRDSWNSPFGSTDSALPDRLNLTTVKSTGPFSEPKFQKRKGKDSKKHGPPAPVGQKAFPESKFTPFSRFGNTDTFRADLLTFIETFYFIQKRLPFLQELDKKFQEHPSRPKVIEGWTVIVEEISESLSNRGVPPYEVKSKDYIDPKFAWAVTLVVNINDKRNLAAKLKEAGITTKEWTALLRKKSHHDYYTMRIEQVFSEDLQNDAKLSIARSIQNGDLNAIKYYNEWLNIYRPEKGGINISPTTSTTYVAEPISQQMITTVLSAIMEILATYVSSEVLLAVAAEIRKNETIKKAIEVRSTEPASNLLQ